MRTIKVVGFPLLLIGFLLMGAVPFSGCKKDDNSDCDSCIVAYKPNIYIYPKEKMQLVINLDFPMGGEIIKSIPEYDTGWNVIVDTNGLIDNTYNYLFYESKQPDIWQQNEGWIIRKDSLEDFFYDNMTNYGFVGREIQDFIDYWIPKLRDSEFYAIYPQSNLIIDNVITLNFSREPDNLLRLFYVVQEQNDIQSQILVKPQINKLFKREEYFATEWGVILK